MGRRHSLRSYNAAPQAALPPPSQLPATAATNVSPQLSSLLSILAPPKGLAPLPFKLPALPTEELVSGISNMARGLVFNGNWWIVLLIIFLFFPNISSRMFGGLLKE